MPKSAAGLVPMDSDLAVHEGEPLIPLILQVEPGATIGDGEWAGLVSSVRDEALTGCLAGIARVNLVYTADSRGDRVTAARVLLSPPLS